MIFVATGITILCHHALAYTPMCVCTLTREDVCSHIHRDIYMFKHLQMIIAWKVYAYNMRSRDYLCVILFVNVGRKKIPEIRKCIQTLSTNLHINFINTDQKTLAQIY